MRPCARAAPRPSYASRRQEGGQRLVEIAPMMPVVIKRAPDLVIKALDIPDGDAIADRVRPPDVQADQVAIRFGVTLSQCRQVDRWHADVNFINRRRFHWQDSRLAEQSTWADVDDDDALRVAAFTEVHSLDRAGVANVLPAGKRLRLVNVSEGHVGELAGHAFGGDHHVVLLGEPEQRRPDCRPAHIYVR